MPWGAVPAGVVLGVVVVVSGLWLKDLGPGNPDRGLVDLVQQARSRALNVLALVLRYGLSVPVAIGWLVLAGTVLWVRDRSPRRAVAFVSLAVPGWVVTAGVKVVVERPRPRGVALFGQLQEVGRHSFPSPTRGSEPGSRALWSWCSAGPEGRWHGWQGFFWACASP